MKTPSIWKQIHDENKDFVDQFDNEESFGKAGLSEADARLVLLKREERTLHGVTQAVPGQWQVRFTIGGRQEILFVCHSLVVAALMRDLFLTMFMRYPHCAPNYSKIDPKKHNDTFNLPLTTRKSYAESVTEITFPLLNFLERVEKILLDRGILHPLSPEEIAAREQLVDKSKVVKSSASQLRYQKRRATQFDTVLEQIQAIAKSHPQVVESCARLSTFLDQAEKSEARLDVLSSQLEFAMGQFESLKKAITEMTATFQKLIDEARAR